MSITAGTLVASPAVAAPRPRLTAPAIALDPNKSPTSSTTMTATWPTAAGVSYSCQLDGGPKSSCSSGSWSSTATIATLADGQHTLSVRASESGYRSATAARSWIVDTQRPQQPTLFATTSPTKTTSVAVQWSDLDPGGIAGYFCALNNPDVTAAVGCGSGSGGSFTLPDGSAVTGWNTVYVWAQDAAGNLSVTGVPDTTAGGVTPGTVTWMVDNSAPAVPSWTVTPPANWNSRTAHFSWTDSDYNGTSSVPVTSFACALDGPPFTPCNNADTAVTVLADGTHTFAVQGQDAAGNVGPSATWTWNVDTVAPPMPFLTTAPPSTTDATTASFAFGDDEAGVSYLCAVDTTDTSVFHPCTSPWATSSNYPALIDGGHTFYVVAKDAAGNLSGAKDYPWTINTSPTTPVVVSSPEFTGGPDAWSNVTSPTFSWIDYETDVAIQDQCKLDAGSWQNCTSGDAFTVTTQGLHVLALRSYAPSSKTASLPVTWSWNFKSTKPSGPDLSTEPALISNSTTAVFAFGSDIGVAFTCQLDTNPIQMCGSPATYLDLADGSHTFSVTATDAAGNFSTTSYTWTIDTSAPPAPDLTGPPAITDNAAPSISWTDTDGTVLSTSTCKLDGVAYATCDPTGTAMSGLSDALHTFTVTVSKNGHDSANSVSWTQDTQAPDVSGVTGVPAQDAYSNAASVTPDVSAVTDAHLDTITCQLDSGTVGPCGTYPLSDGAHTLSVVATDKATNSATFTRTWTVDTVAPNLTVTGVPNNGTAINANHFTAAISGDGGALTCSLTGPTSSTACGASQDYTGLGDGAYTYTVTSTDLAGNVATFTRSFAIDTAPPSAVISTPTTLTNSARVVWSEPVSNLAAGSLTLATRDTHVVLATVRTCYSLTSAVTSCAGVYKSVQMRPAKPLTPGQYYTVALAAGAAKDAVNNPSVAKSVSFRAQRVVEENSVAVTQTWRRVRSTNALGGSYVHEHTAGAQASYSFRGTSVTWYTVTGRNQGKALILVDGKAVRTVNDYATATHFKVARTVSGLRSGAHRLSVRVLGRKGTRAATGTFVTVDGFKVGGTLDKTPRLAMTVRRVAGTQFLAGHASVANLAGDAFTLQFRGTSFIWYTEKSRTMGKARIYVDGVLEATVDNYGSVTRYHVARTVKGLTDRVHTLRIVVLGKHRAASGGTAVVVDRFQVT